MKWHSATDDYLLGSQPSGSFLMFELVVVMVKEQPVSQWCENFS
jgi:hypothetical protein